MCSSIYFLKILWLEFKVNIHQQYHLLSEIYLISDSHDIYLIAGSNDELQTLTNKLSNSVSRYGMQISAEKSKIMINSNNRNLNSNIQLYGEKLEEVDQFKYLVATITKDGSSESENEIRLAQAISAMAIAGKANYTEIYPFQAQIYFV